MEQRRIESLTRHPALEKCAIPIAVQPVISEPTPRVPSITEEGWILYGEDVVENARLRGEATMQCIVYNLGKKESLKLLLEEQQKRATLNGYCRVILALLLESHLRSELLATRHKGQADNPSNLTGQAREVRTIISAMTKVSSGNISKVRHIRDHGIGRLQEEMKVGTRSIHSGYLISHLPPTEQMGALAVPGGKRACLQRVDKLLRGARPVPEALKQFLKSVRHSVEELDPQVFASLCRRVHKILDEIEATLAGIESGGGNVDGQ